MISIKAKIAKIKWKRIIYPVILGLFVIATFMLFRSVLIYFEAVSNKIFSDSTAGLDQKITKFDTADYQILAQKFGLSIQAPSVVNLPSAVASVTTTANVSSTVNVSSTTGVAIAASTSTFTKVTTTAPTAAHITTPIPTPSTTSTASTTPSSVTTPSQAVSSSNSGPVSPVSSSCPVFKSGDLIKVKYYPAIYAIDFKGRWQYFPDGDVYKSWTNNDKYGGYILVSQICFDSLHAPTSAFSSSTLSAPPK